MPAKVNALEARVNTLDNNLMMTVMGKESVTATKNDNSEQEKDVLN